MLVNVFARYSVLNMVDVIQQNGNHKHTLVTRRPVSAVSSVINVKHSE